MKIALVYITHETKKHACIFGQQIVERKLAACYNVFPIKSMFWWNQALESTDEWVTLLKTSKDSLPLLREAAQQLHPYQVPCIMSWEVEVNDEYGKWILASLE